MKKITRFSFIFVIIFIMFLSSCQIITDDNNKIDKKEEKEDIKEKDDNNDKKEPLNTDDDLIKTFKVKFMDGDIEINSLDVEEGKKIGSYTPSKDNYTFEGFYTDSALTKKYSINSIVIKNLTLYIKWEAINCEVIFMDGNTPLDVQNVRAGKTIALFIPEKNNYDFAGWCVDKELTLRFDVNEPITSSMILYAKWSKEKVDVIFKDSSEIIKTDKVELGSKANEFIPEKEHYEFVGWYSDSLLSTKFDFDTEINSTKTLYAKWNRLKYDIFFMDGNSKIITETIYSGDAISKHVPTKAHYTFVGWYTDKNLNNVYDEKTKITSEMILYAKWEPIYYNVKFMYDENTMNIQSIQSGTTISGFVPKKAHYTFDGWYTDSNLNNSFSLNTLITSEITLYAKWSPIVYNVKYMDNENTLLSVKANSGNKLDNYTPVKANYTFAGWYTDKALTLNFDTDEAIVSSITLYAKWSQKTYDVVFKDSNVVLKVLEVEGGTKIEEYTPTKEHYQFAGWYNDISLTYAFDMNTLIVSPKTLHAKWNRLTYDVSFMDGDTILKTETVNSGDVISNYNPTKNTMVFVGWYLDKNFDEVFDDNTKIVEEITLYAKWDKVKYNITFKDGEITLKQEQVEVNDKIKEFTPTKDNYQFVGWYKDELLTNLFDINTAIAESQTLYAKWEEVLSPVPTTHEITFMDGDTELKSEFVESGKALVWYSPKKEHYQFIAWYKDATLTEAFDMDTLITESQVLYAKWNRITYTVLFKDGTTELKNIIVNSGDILSTYEPTKDHYSFDSWYLDTGLNNIYDESNVITSNLTLYAKWNKITYRVLYMDGTDEIKDLEVESGNKISPYTPEKTHYTFEGWYKDLGYNEAFNYNAVIITDVVLYAKWNKITYRVLYMDGTDEMKDLEVESGNKISPYTPEKTHYTFEGWYKDLGYNEAFNYNAVIITDVVLYAKWQIITYNVIFLDGDTELKSEVVDSGNKTESFEPTKEDCCFIGWYEDENFNKPFDFDTIVISNITLYSKWYDLVEFENIGSTTKVGMNYKINGTVERKLPIVNNEGSVGVYPEWFTAYPSSYNDSDYISLALENVSLISSDTNYNYMDKDGNLYLRNSSGELTPTGKKLYKHTASLTMYTNPDLADRTKAYIPDDEPAVSKTINIYDPKLLGNYVTGLYAQPGEVIEINISENDLKRIGGLTVCIGNRRSHEFYNASTTDANNIGFMTNGKRMPIIHQMFTVKETKAYVGSFLGGPIYIEPTNKVAFSVTINGALEYLHYIDGLTTKEEFERLEKTKAPYFDLEIYDTGARFSGPRYTVNPIEGIENGVSSLSYDNYVKTSRLWSAINEYSMLVPHARNDYINIEMCFETNVVGGLAMAYIGANYCRLPIGWMPTTLSYDSFMRSGGWGVIHEYNHHHQKYGANGSSNEVTNNIVNYMEYVLLTNITAFRNYGTSGHEIGLSSHYDIEYLNQYFGTTTTLNEEKGYALLVQNFGPLNFLAVAVAQKNDSLNGAQVERNTNWYKRLCNTLEMDFTYLIRDLWHLELDSSAVSEIEAKDYPVYLPVGSFYATNFQFTNKSGVLNSNNALPYYCNSTLTLDLANDINVVNGCTVEILDVGDPTYGTLTYDSISNTYLYENKTDKIDSFDVEVKVTKDNIEEIVIITMSFKPINSCISVETYEMGNDTYNNIREALADDFSKATSKTISQSSSQKITGIKNGTITKVRGSFISTYEGTYDLCYCGGRGSSVMFAGINTQELEEIGYILINQSGYQFDSNAHSNKEVTLHKGDIVYYELYLLSTSNNAWLQIGLSPDKIAKNVITLDDSLFGSFDGKYIKDVPLEIPNDNYKKSYKLNVDLALDYSNYEATSEKFEPWDSTTTLLNIFDDNPNNYTHTKRYMYVSETNPIDVIVDCKRFETFNAISVEAYNSAQNYTPRKFDIYFSDDGIEFTLVKSIDTPSGSDRVNLVKFDEYQTTRYIKFIFKNSNGATNYFALSGIKLKCIEEFNLEQWNPDIATYYGNVLRNDIGLYGHGYTLNEESKVDFNAITNKVIFKTKIDSNDFKVLVNNNIITNYEVYDFPDGYSYIIIDNLNENDLVSIINLDGELKIFSISS